MDELIYRQLYAMEDSHWWFRGRRAVIRALLKRAAPMGGAGTRILDAGCGTGRNLQEYARLGTATGVEPSPSAVEFCRERGLDRVVQAELEQLPFGNGDFDLLVASDVIEHIEDDGAALRELRRVAAPGARLVLTVPAYQWLWSQHDETHHHKRRYARRQLVERVREAGWRVELATYFNSILLPPIAAVRAFRRGGQADSTDYELTNSVLNRILAVPMEAEARLIALGVRFPAGVSIGLVASS